MNNIREDQQVYEQQFEAIDAPERIFSLLKPVIGNETSLRVIADNNDEIFHTTLLDIDYDRKLLTLKKVKYTFGHLMVIDAKRLTIFSQHDGAEVSFTTYLSRYSEKNNGYYEIRFPATVKYCQRRMSHLPIVSTFDFPWTSWPHSLMTTVKLSKGIYATFPRKGCGYNCHRSIPSNSRKPL